MPVQVLDPIFLTCLKRQLDSISAQSRWTGHAQDMAYISDLDGLQLRHIRMCVKSLGLLTSE